MKRYFVDAAHFIALANPKDQHHHHAVRIATELVDAILVTTEDVLIELLNFYAQGGEFMRRKVVDLARTILNDPRIEIIPRTDVSLIAALDLYESRPDKGYSLTDCISMNVCKELGISEVLTSDKHFQQEGLEILL